MLSATKQYVLVVLDGAGDSNRIGGNSPLHMAHTPGLNAVARQAVTGRMITLYPDLPRDSLVAHLGIFGWEPHQFYPHGRASSEVLAAHDLVLNDGDLVFRANIVRMDGPTLASYNADYIHSDHALQLVRQINTVLRPEFPNFELYHNSDFRTTLLIRNAHVAASTIGALEPHENQGRDFDLGQLLQAKTAASETLVQQINQYLQDVGVVLGSDTPYHLFPWGVSHAFALPAFHDVHHFTGHAAVIGNMDFLHGMAKAGGMEFCKLGTGRPETDYVGKGAALQRYLSQGYDFVACHINSPDEASHMYDVPLKIRCIEQIDTHIIQPLVDYFTRHPTRLGGVMILPDHYTNTQPPQATAKRIDSHSLDPVPFMFWNGRDVDQVEQFTEDAVLEGRYGAEPMSHLHALPLLGITQKHKEYGTYDRITE